MRNGGTRHSAIVMPVWRKKNRKLLWVASQTATTHCTEQLYGISKTDSFRPNRRNPLKTHRLAGCLIIGHLSRFETPYGCSVRWETAKPCCWCRVKWPLLARRWLETHDREKVVCWHGSQQTHISEARRSFRGIVVVVGMCDVAVCRVITAMWCAGGMSGLA